MIIYHIFLLCIYWQQLLSMLLSPQWLVCANQKKVTLYDFERDLLNIVFQNTPHNWTPLYISQNTLWSSREIPPAHEKRTFRVRFFHVYPLFTESYIWQKWKSDEKHHLYFNRFCEKVIDNISAVPDKSYTLTLNSCFIASEPLYCQKNLISRIPLFFGLIFW